MGIGLTCETAAVFYFKAGIGDRGGVRDSPHESPVLPLFHSRAAHAPQPRQPKQLPLLHDDDELNISSPTPCQIGNRPPAPITATAVCDGEVFLIMFFTPSFFT